MTRRFTPSGADVDSLIEPILVLSSKFLETEQESIPDYFWPVSGRWGIRGQFTHICASLALILMLDTDLHKTYIDDEHYNSGHGHAYEKYGVDPRVGAVVIVRPDQCKYQNVSLKQEF